MGLADDVSLTASTGCLCGRVFCQWSERMRVTWCAVGSRTRDGQNGTARLPELTVNCRTCRVYSHAEPVCRSGVLLCAAACGITSIGTSRAWLWTHEAWAGVAQYFLRTLSNRALVQYTRSHTSLTPARIVWARVVSVSPSTARHHVKHPTLHTTSRRDEPSVCSVSSQYVWKGS